jgi:hypothetical protein
MKADARRKTQESRPAHQGMTVDDRIAKIKALYPSPLYYFGSACHNFLVAIEKEGQYTFLTEHEAKVHQQGIKDLFQVKTTLTHTTLSL